MSLKTGFVTGGISGYSRGIELQINKISKNIKDINRNPYKVALFTIEGELLDLEKQIDELDRYETRDSQENSLKEKLLKQYAEEFHQLSGTLNQPNSDFTVKQMQEMAFNTELYTERREKLLQLNGLMGEVAQMMKTTAETVKEQGEDLDRIDIHVAETLKHTEKAGKQLELADRSQRRKKNFCKCMFLLSVSTVISIVLILLLAKEAN